MDVYFKKQITYFYEGIKFTFNVGNTLFSTFDIDHGTDILLRSISFKNPKSILDLGCGYGPIGIVLAKKFPSAQVTLLDKDLLAVRYSQYNIKENAIDNASAFGSVGLEQVNGEMFDLIVSNIPAKIGDEAITTDFILTPYSHLNPNGELWMVIVSALNHLIPKVAMKNKLNLKKIRKRHGHIVYQILKK